MGMWRKPTARRMGDLDINCTTQSPHTNHKQPNSRQPTPKQPLSSIPLYGSSKTPVSYEPDNQPRHLLRPLIWTPMPGMDLFDTQIREQRAYAIDGFFGGDGVFVTGCLWDVGQLKFWEAEDEWESGVQRGLRGLHLWSAV